MHGWRAALYFGFVGVTGVILYLGWRLPSPYLWDMGQGFTFLGLMLSARQYYGETDARD